MTERLSKLPKGTQLGSSRAGQRQLNSRVPGVLRMLPKSSPPTQDRCSVVVITVIILFYRWANGLKEWYFHHHPMARLCWSPATSQANSLQGLYPCIASKWNFGLEEFWSHQTNPCGPKSTSKMICLLRWRFQVMQIHEPTNGHWVPSACNRNVRSTSGHVNCPWLKDLTLSWKQGTLSNLAKQT